mgnify:CR=1 FL=1
MKRIIERDINYSVLLAIIFFSSIKYDFYTIINKFSGKAEIFWWWWTKYFCIVYTFNKISAINIMNYWKNIQIIHDIKHISNWFTYTYASIICLGVVTPPFKTSCVNNDFDSLASLLYLAILYLIDLLGSISWALNPITPKASLPNSYCLPLSSSLPKSSTGLIAKFNLSIYIHFDLKYSTALISLMKHI